MTKGQGKISGIVGERLGLGERLDRYTDNQPPLLFHPLVYNERYNLTGCSRHLVAKTLEVRTVAWVVAEADGVGNSNSIGPCLAEAWR